MEGKHKKDQDGCPDVEAVKADLRKRFEELLAFCCDRRSDLSRFHRFETELFKRVFELARLLVLLFLTSRHQQLNLRLHYSSRKYRHGEEYAERQLQTVFGEVTYGRVYLKRRQGGSGYHPLDVDLGLTRDGYSPGVTSFLARLATRMSYESVRVISRCAWGWAPSTETLHRMVLGLGRYASGYVNAGQWWRKNKKKDREGNVLVIEEDGKCPPTATAEELAKRRRPRPSCPHCCQRHRGKIRRKQRGPKKRRRKGDKSKNGKEAMVIVMYTLRRGADGLLHGPINKKVWATFAGRRAAAAWARAEATRRGFPPSRNRDVQVVIDGAKGLEENMRALFAGAIFTLDVRHVEEKIWTAGRAFHREGSDALAAWVEERQKQLYKGQPKDLLAWLQGEQDRLAAQRGTKARQQALQQLITYMQPRLSMLRYAMFKRKDLVLATGQVEGAVRYVVAQRFDCAGMRWIVENAESLLQLRCLEVNGDWADFFVWTMRQNEDQLRHHEKVQIRTKTPAPLADAA
jgi:Uncharacterised protein family (UPF0236)